MESGLSIYQTIVETMIKSSHRIFDSDLAVLVQYPTGAGGKFIINCLSFHPMFHPQSMHFIARIDDRIDYITRELMNYDGHNWNDLNMGCHQFFGVASLFPDEDDLETESHSSDIWRNSLAVLLPCVANNLHFFKTTHTLYQSNFYKRIWPNAKRIVMTNCEEFIRARNGKCHRDWNPKITIDGLDIDDAFSFDGSALLDWNNLSIEYTKLLSWFGYDPVNMDKIRSFHEDYIKAIIG